MYIYYLQLCKGPEHEDIVCKNCSQEREKSRKGGCSTIIVVVFVVVAGNLVGVLGGIGSNATVLSKQVKFQKRRW